MKAKFARWAVSTAAALGLAASVWAAADAPQVEVWKDPNCGCCKEWIAHLEKEGFKVRTHEVGNDLVRARLGLPERYASCHTAQVEGYVLEGHVPASDIRRLLSEKPAALGLAAPGMPVGAPGMDGPAYGGRHDPYNVLLVQRDGRASVYAHHE